MKKSEHAVSSKVEVSISEAVGLDIQVAEA